MMLRESCRFSEPINKVAQNVCLLFTLHVCVFVCVQNKTSEQVCDKGS